MKKILSIMLTLSLALSLTVCNVYTVSAATKPTKMTLSTSSAVIDIGQKITIKVKTVKPKKASKSVTYKTNNKAVAIVSKKGVVTGKSVGIAKITVTSKSNKKLKKTVKIEVNPEKAIAINEYNIEKKRIKNMQNNLDEAISNAKSALKKGTPLFVDCAEALSSAIDVAKQNSIVIPKLPNTTDEINSLVAELKAVDITPTIEDIVNKTNELIDQIARNKRLIKPDEKTCIERLKTVSGVRRIAAATEENDPNGELGKQGGYYSAIVFEHTWVNQDFSGDVVQKGTDCGGTIEMYSTRAAAEKRDAYLSAFDGGFLSSGSHYVCGTIVIRTSSELTASKQKQLTKDVAYALSEA